MNIVDKKENHFWKIIKDDTSTRESLLAFLKNYSNAELEIVESGECARKITFSINEVYYEIIWCINVCTLYTGETKKHPLQIKFDTIFTDRCYPVIPGSNDNLTFMIEGNEIAHLPLPPNSLKYSAR